MLAHLFVRSSVIARLRSGPLGPYLDDFATFLQQEGYARSHIQRSLRAGDQFARWLHGQDAPLSARWTTLPCNAMSPGSNGYYHR